MQNGRKKSKPLNLIKQTFPSQAPQDDQDGNNSQIEQPNKKPIRTANGSLNLIAEAFMQEDRSEESKQIEQSKRRQVRKTVSGSLNLIAEAFMQEDQGEDEDQSEEEVQANKQTEPLEEEKISSEGLSLWKQILRQSGQNIENNQVRQKKEQAIAQDMRSLNITWQSFGKIEQNKGNGKDSQQKSKTIRNNSRPLNLIKEAFDQK